MLKNLYDVKLKVQDHYKSMFGSDFKRVTITFVVFKITLKHTFDIQNQFNV